MLIWIIQNRFKGQNGGMAEKAERAEKAEEVEWAQEAIWVHHAVIVNCVSRYKCHAFGGILDLR